MPRTKTAELPVLRINRTFRAPRERVFRAFTDPTRMARWWGPEGMSVPVCELDPRAGGAWRTTMRSPDGQEMTVSGIYKEVDPPSRLVFTWAWTEEDGSRGHETVVTLEFLDRGETTELVMTHEGFVDEEIRGKHQHGWNGCFDCLEQALAEEDV